MTTFIDKIQKIIQLMILTVMVVVYAMDAGAVEILPNAKTSLQLEHSKSRLVRLSRPAASVFIANPEIADVQVKSPTLVYVFGKAVGVTTLYAVDSSDRVLANINVNITHNLQRLRQEVSNILPQSKINFASVNGSLIMDGEVFSTRELAQVKEIAKRYSPADDGIINRLNVSMGNQVNLRVRIAEVSREVNKRLGFDWTALGSISGLNFGLALANPFDAVDQVGRLAFSSSDISGAMDAMEDEGLISILSEPNLTAMSGEEASFLAGGEFPVLYPEDDKIKYEYKEFGVRLNFKPVILDSGRINLKVEPEVSSISESNSVTLSGFVIPALTTRRANTTVELASGQSFAIAGLLQNRVGHNLAKFPWLADIPILGTLFRSDSFQREETELVIVVTPYLVKPMTHAKAKLPTDGFSPAHDVERIFYGRSFRRNQKVGKGINVDEQGRSLIGPAGFELN